MPFTQRAMVIRTDARRVPAVGPVAVPFDVRAPIPPTNRLHFVHPDVDQHMGFVLEAYGSRLHVAAFVVVNTHAFAAEISAQLRLEGFSVSYAADDARLHTQVDQFTAWITGVMVVTMSQFVTATIAEHEHMQSCTVFFLDQIEDEDL